MHKLLSALVFLTAIIVVCLSGCAGTPQSDFVNADLRAADFNLQTAIQKGRIPADDPAAGCVHALVGDPVTAFDPQVTGLISGASAAYIEIQAIRSPAPVSCDAVLGRLVKDAARVGIRVSPLRLP